MEVVGEAERERRTKNEGQGTSEVRLTPSRSTPRLRFAMQYCFAAPAGADLGGGKLASSV
jgi:hypothetical protein